MSDDHLDGTTRRGLLRATAGVLGVAATGTASAHEWGSSTTTTAITGDSPTSDDAPGNSVGATPVGYHSLGGVGSESSRAGSPRHPHYGGVTEIRTHGDYAYVAFFSSDSPTPGRGMAIVDIGSYNDATTPEEAEAANMSVVSYVRNESTGTAVMDLKVSDDGDYVFMGTQPYTALFGDEALDPTPNTDDHSFTEVPGAVVAVDVSDRGNPETVGAFQVSGTGVHNLFHHRIGGSEYVFAIHDLQDGTEGMYVLEFDRASGQLEPVNQWSLSGDLRQGEVNPDMLYIHDVEVQDDPVTGRPTAYLAYWGQGLQVLDVSDPTDISLRGHFEMSACHFATPAPRIWETPSGERKRVCIASQEVPANESRTGTVHLVDASGLYEADTDVLDGLVESDEGGVAQLAEFDVWEWQNEDDPETDPGDVSFGNFELSPHNSDVAIDEDGELWVHQAHYHGGVRYLQATEEADGSLGLVERGFARPKYGTPVESRMQGLTEVTPNCWAAVESNGVTFASDINQGVHAVLGDGVAIGGAPPSGATVSTTDDGAVFTGGATDQIDLALEYLRRYDAVRVRDRLPTSWGVAGGDANETYEAGGSRFVEFSGALSVGEGRTYFADVPDATGSYTLGPVEVSPDGETWYAVPGTLRTNQVVGSDLTVGTALGAVGVLGSQRERFRERLGGLLDDE